MGRCRTRRLAPSGQLQTVEIPHLARSTPWLRSSIGPRRIENDSEVQRLHRADFHQLLALVGESASSEEVVMVKLQLFAIRR